MAKVKGAIVVDIERCKGCEVCNPACTFDVLAMSGEVNGKGYNYCYMKDPDSCTGCSNCAIVCPDGVITVYRTKIDNS
ncbi:ferredoxin family protein [Bacteroidota bacterium]